jgi:Sugar phosphate permease
MLQNELPLIHEYSSAYCYNFTWVTLGGEKLAGINNGGSSYFEGIKVGSSHKKFLWLIAVAYIFDQVDNATFSYAAPSLLKYLNFTREQIANINSCNYFGMFLGAIFGGWLSDRIGRKRGLITTVSIFSLASISNGLGSTFPVIAISRALTGFGVVATVVIAMVYIAEMMPSDQRGRYQSLTIASGTIGVPIIGSFAAWFIPQAVDNWRIVFFIGGTGIFIPILSYFWLKESPRWLVSKGRITEAEIIVKEITGREIDLSSEANSNIKKSSNIEALRIMLSKGYILRTFILVVLSLGITLGAFFLSGFYTTAMTEGGMAMSTVLMVMAVAAWGIPLGDFISSFVSDKGGRKIPIAIFCFLQGAAAILAGATFIPVIIATGLIIQRVFGAGSMTMLWTYLAESFPTHIRNNAVGITFGLARIVASLSQFALPGLYAAHGWFGLNAVNAVIIIVPAVIALIWGEKTSRKSLEELNSTAQA